MVTPTNPLRRQRTDTLLGGRQDDSLGDRTVPTYLRGPRRRHDPRGAGDDVIWGDDADPGFDRHGDDFLNGGGGNDTVRGGVATTRSGAGAATFSRRSGNRRTAWQGGIDTLQGGGGNDTLIWKVGEGSDQMDGGDADDTVHSRPPTRMCSPWPGQRQHGITNGSDKVDLNGGRSNALNSSRVGQRPGRDQLAGIGRRN
ncbi:MAG: hypothetical protein Ct9H300mP1_26770 [Planctomycetaceae bacterium]|nr:MAG: hypothetical protein Ct9H300mP1_26770 [Planctomycetaceae bacterium]